MKIGVNQLKTQLYLKYEETNVDILEQGRSTCGPAVSEKVS
jgi:hypothetical protein